MGDSVPFLFTYRLLRHGWAEVTVKSGERIAPMVVSYLSDALCDLLDAVFGIVDGEDQTEAVLEDEPGEWVWTFRRTGGLVNIEVRLLDGSHSKGREVVSAATTALDLATQVSEESDHLLREFGEDGYRERWIEHPFPMASHLRLAQWVASNSHHHT